MHISSVQITSFKSYRESNTLELSTGFNIVTGQNNAGKTALLEALRGSIENKPHRSQATVPRPGSPPSASPAITLAVVLKQEELADSAFDHISICIPTHSQTQHEAGTRVILNKILEQTSIKFDIRLAPGNASPARVPSFGDYEAYIQNNHPYYAQYRRADGKYKFTSSVHGTAHDIATKVAHYYLSRTYYFRAERYNVGSCRFGHNTLLQSDASNLAEVLSNLQSNPFRFRRYNETVRRILPQIRQVTVHNQPNNMVEVLSWSHDPASERHDLAIPLSESGTGVGQVLSMLYIVLNSDYPQTILIDEPNSFLHPGATRKLIEVLKEHPQHQYIVTTHSPNVITSASPATVTLVKQTDGVSDFYPINPNENEQLRQYLVEIGARLSDTFGADNILWVEGPTEELCFPQILERAAKRSLMGTAIVGVRSTGDLEGRHARTVLDIYSQLSRGCGLLPPAIGFILDTETRKDNALEELRKASSGRVHFLPRRMYENYLLNPKAITYVINSIDGFRDAPISEDEVTNWINNEIDAWKHGQRHSRKYGTYSEAKGHWQVYIHAANLLSTLFSELSETRVSYDKVAYSVPITKWIVDNSPDDLREICHLLCEILDNPV